MVGQAGQGTLASGFQVALGVANFHVDAVVLKKNTYIHTSASF